MTTAIVIGVVALFGLALVASQLVRLKEWLRRTPPPPADPPGGE